MTLTELEAALHAKEAAGEDHEAEWKALKKAVLREYILGRLVPRSDDSELRKLMPEVLAALDATGVNVSLAADVRKALQ